MRPSPLVVAFAVFGVLWGAWQAVLALSGRTLFADRAVALARYNRAVGVEALVQGLVAAKADLQDRVLGDSRIEIYPGGRSDIAAGKVDVRILALLRYLAEAHGQVTVSCLISGHGLYARPGAMHAGFSQFQAFDQAGHLFEMAVEGTAGEVLDVGTLAAGERVRGVIAFDMPRGDTTLIMSDDSDQTVTALRVPD